MKRFSAEASSVSVPVMATRALNDTATEQRQATAVRLTQLRTILSGNQASVARAVGVGTNTWNRYEKGTRDLDPYVLAIFAKRFGVTPERSAGFVAWVLLGDPFQLPKDVLVQLTLAYPEVLRAQEPSPAPNTRRALDNQAPVAQP